MKHQKEIKMAVNHLINQQCLIGPMARYVVPCFSFTPVMLLLISYRRNMDRFYSWNAAFANLLRKPGMLKRFRLFSTPRSRGYPSWPTMVPVAMSTSRL